MNERTGLVEDLLVGPPPEAMARDRLDPPPFEGRRVRLTTVTPEDHRFLFALATSAEMSYRWRYRNQIPRFEAFVQQLDADVLAQFVVRHRPDDEPIGHVVAYAPDLANGHAYVAGVFGPTVIGLHFGAEALALFIDYLFATWDLMKLYAEIPEFVYQTIRDRIVEPFRLEAHYHDHIYYRGRHWDFLVFSVARSEWPGCDVWEFNPTEAGPRKPTSAERES